MYVKFRTVPLLIVIVLRFIHNAKAHPLVRDVGVIGLFSHDVFAWDSDNETNTENGRLDLSTIFEYGGGSRIDEGGNPKNSENAPVFTITMQLVNFYKNSLQERNADDSRRATVAMFMDMVRESFVRLTLLDFPAKGINGNVTNVEQAVFRAMHDILPGRIRYYNRGLRSLLGMSLKVTNAFRAKTMLNEKELDQEIKEFDGKYDEEYESIRIPFAGITVNLTAVDGAFIKKFSNYTQEMMLTELGRVGSGEKKMADVGFMRHVVKLMRKAICPKGNLWMMQDVACD